MNMYGAGNILKAIKKMHLDAKTFLGGLHPSSLPERTLREEAPDFVCQGEGFYTVIKLLKTLKSDKRTNDLKIKGLWYLREGQVISNPREELIMDLDEIPFAAWDLLPMDRYRAHNWHCFQDLDQRQPYAVIYTSLGCPFKCNFCCINSIFGKTGIRYRSPQRSVEEICFLSEKYKVRNIKIMDEMFVFDEPHVIEICDLLIKKKLNLNIWAYARIDTINKRILKKMKKAGFSWLAFGIESANQSVLRSVQKGRFDQDKIFKSVKMVQDAGIFVGANYIFGLPEDNLDTMNETLSLAEKLNCEYANFYVAMAYPGSRLYEEAVRIGIKLPDSWLGYAQYSEETLPLSNRYLSSSAILNFRDEAVTRYFSRPEYLKMLEAKFGNKTAAHVKEMLKIKIKRKFI